MNQLLISVVIVIMGFLHFAQAVDFPGYDMNVVMSCGDKMILSHEYTTRQQGYLAASGLGDEIIAETKADGQRMTLIKTEEAQSSWWGLGDKEGVGLYENEEFILDLRKSSVKKDVFLEDKATGQKVQCRIYGDCC